MEIIDILIMGVFVNVLLYIKETILILILGVVQAVSNTEFIFRMQKMNSKYRAIISKLTPKQKTIYRVERILSFLIPFAFIIVYVNDMRILLNNRLDVVSLFAYDKERIVRRFNLDEE